MTNFTHFNNLLSKPLFTLLTLLTIGVGNAWGQTYNGGTWYSLYDGNTYTNGNILNIDIPKTVVPPTTKSIQVDWYKDRTKVVIWYNTGFDLWIDDNQIVSSAITKSQDSWTTATGSVAEDATSVKVTYHNSTKGCGHIRNIRIPMKKHIWLQTADGNTVSDKLTKDFTKVPWGTTKELPVNFRSFLTNGNITITIEGDSKNEFSFSQSSASHTLTQSSEKKSYSVGANMCASANGTAATCSTGTLGKISNYDFKVYFRPQKANVGTKYTGKTVYVKITDGTSTAYVYLNGTNDKRGQTIQSFSTTAETHNTTDAITTFTAYATDNVNNAKTDLPITYSSSNTNIATVGQSTGVVTLVGGGTTVTLTAKQAGDTYYYETSKSVTYTVNKVAPTIVTNPAGSAVNYLQTLNNSTLSGGKATVTLRGVANTEVAGSFEWTSPTKRVEDEAGSHSYEVTFKPSNTAMYTTSTCSVSITVNKIAQSIVMKDETVRVKVSGPDANATDSHLDLTNCITSQTNDPVDSNRDGAVTFQVLSAQNDNNNVSSTNITNNVFTATVCDTYTIRATKAGTKYYNEQSTTFKVTVIKRANTLTVVGNQDKYVDAEVTNVRSNQNNTDVAVQTESSDPSIAYYDIASNKIYIPNSEAKSFNSTPVTIKIWQDANAQFEASGVKTIVVTVKKYDNTINITGFTDNAHDDEHHIQTDWYNTPLYVLTSNTDTVTYKIFCEQIQGDNNMASFGRNLSKDAPKGSWVVYTRQNTGVVKWRIWQNETYKYKYGEKVVSVKVITPSCDCNLVNISEEENFLKLPPHTVSTIGNEGLIDFSQIGIGDSLFFSIKKNGINGDDLNYNFYITNEETGTSDWGGKTHTFVNTDDIGSNGYNNRAFRMGDETHHVTMVEFSKGHTSDLWIGGDTDDPFINHIRVTRKRWLKTLNANNQVISALPYLERKVGDPAKTASFKVDFSTCDSVFKVASNYENVTFTNKKQNDTISKNPAEDKTIGYAGNESTTLSYSSDTIEDKIVTITVYNKYQNKTLSLHVKTIGKEAEIYYKGANSYAVNSSDISASALFGVRDKNTKEVISGAQVTISGGNSAASVVNNALDPLCGGKVTITASFAGNSYYEPATDLSKEITITKIDDEITINNSTTALTVGETLDLVSYASATSGNTVAFEPSNTSVLKIEDGKLKAIGEGEVDLQLTTEADACTYNAGSKTQHITVEFAEYVFVGDGDWDSNGWKNDNKPDDNIVADVTVTGQLVIDQAYTVNRLTIKENGSVTTVENGKLTVNGTSKDADKYGDLHVKNGGEVVLNGQLKVRNFILDAKLGNTSEHAASGQVTNPQNLMNINGQSYFQMDFDPEGKISYGWYNFTVPFAVDINGGISRVNSSDNKVMVNNVDFIVMEADEQNRANGGKGWRRLNGGVLKPGKLYTITLDDEVNQNTLRFTWNGNGSLSNGASYDAKFATGSANNSLHGWNGMGNGMLRHGHLATNYKTQVYNHAENKYEVADSSMTFAVGSAFFIQVGTSGTVNWTAAEATKDHPLYAPQREIEEIDEFRLALRKEGTDKKVDVLYFSASEDATEAYAIGHDLLKMGTPTEAKTAQIWATKGGKVLCDVEAALYSDNAATPLSLFAPQDGWFILSVDEAPKDATLYLTYNDDVIWDLTYSPYSFDLTKGTTEGFGLRMALKKTPQIATGVEDVQGDETQKAKARKVLIDNKIFLITPDGTIYDATGKSVR